MQIGLTFFSFSTAAVPTPASFVVYTYSFSTVSSGRLEYCYGATWTLTYFIFAYFFLQGNISAWIVTDLAKMFYVKAVKTDIGLTARTLNQFSEFSGNSSPVLRQPENRVEGRIWTEKQIRVLEHSTLFFKLFEFENGRN